jgi:hypothetical protein
MCVYCVHPGARDIREHLDQTYGVSALGHLTNTEYRKVLLPHLVKAKMATKTVRRRGGKSSWYEDFVYEKFRFAMRILHDPDDDTWRNNGHLFI